MNLKSKAKTTLRKINDNKFLFVLLFTIQILLIITFAFTFLTFHLKILEDARGIIEPVENANFDSEQLQDGQVFLDNPYTIYQSYNAMLKDLTYLLTYLIGIFIIFNGALWMVTHKLVSRTKFSLRPFIKFVTTFITGLLPFFLIAYLLLKNVLLSDNPTDEFSKFVKICVFIFGVIYYFLLCFFTNINTKSWKLFVRKSLNLASDLKKTIPVLLVNIILIGLAVYLIYYMLANQINQIVIGTIILILTIIITRIYWITCLNENNY